MRVSAERSYPAADFDSGADTVVRRAIGEIEVGIELIVDPEGGGDTDFVISDVGAEGENVIASIGMGAVKIGIGAASESQFFGSFDFTHGEQGIADIDPLNAAKNFFGFVQLVFVEL